MSRWALRRKSESWVISSYRAAFVSVRRVFARVDLSQVFVCEPTGWATRKFPPQQVADRPRRILRGLVVFGRPGSHLRREVAAPVSRGYFAGAMLRGRAVDSSAGPSSSATATAGDALTAAIDGARRGFRRDVAAFIEELGKGRLFVPLARPIADVPTGVEVEMGSELSLSPHLIVDSDDIVYCALFSEATMVEAAAAQFGWQTGGSPLEYIALPANVALEVALDLVDGEKIMGLIFNPLDDTELMLQREELASITQGKAVPLVGYVADIPFTPDEKLLVAELDAPPPAEVTSAIEGLLNAQTPPLGYVLRKTYNAERDVEPHWTLNLISEDPGADLTGVAEELAGLLEGKLSAPGYIDILFNSELLK